MNLGNVEHLLPEAIQTMIRIIGLPSAVRLVEQLGGTTFPVALRKSRLGEMRYEMLAEFIGPSAADAMTEHFGGESLYIPRCAAAMRELAHREIRREFDVKTKGGEASAIQIVAMLALRYQMSDRHIWRVLKRPDTVATESDQPTLF